MSESQQYNTIILITGANTGIGLATVQALLTSPTSETRNTIILTSRSLDRANKAVEELKADSTYSQAFSSGNQVIPKQLDLNDEESAKSLHDDIKKSYGRVDVLINNAGAHYDFPIAAGKMTRREGFIKAFYTNVVATDAFTELFMDLLFEAESQTQNGARLIYLSSGISSLTDHSNQNVPVNQSPAAGWPKRKPVFQVPTYRTSKTAMNMMILEWVRTLKNDNIKIHIIDPGFNATNLGGGDIDLLRSKGAQEPIKAGLFIKSVIQGERDNDQGKLIGKDGVIPW
ncbi:uncharacterized protein L201_006455 [Kwoniella dendrophila CBS 6074]|uniref:Short-chain dehydrogenase n=1 Tax=Kwoniella dendrophila CBS 6074 TaxID=1295534 RepID=A0AAX4K326_9TREE